MTATLPMSDEEFARQSAASRRRGAQRLKHEPLATAVCYDAETRCVVIALNTGASLSIPTALLEGLQKATVRDLRAVTILGPGIAIEFPTLDQQFGVSGLMKGVFGFPEWMRKLAMNSGPQTSAKSTETTSRSGTSRRKEKRVAVTSVVRKSRRPQKEITDSRPSK